MHNIIEKDASITELKMRLCFNQSEEMQLKINQSALAFHQTKTTEKIYIYMMITRGFATHAADSWNKVHDVEYYR